MDRQALIASLAEQPGDAVLLARIWEKLSAGARGNYPTSSCFLSGREQALAQMLARRGGLEEPRFFGGFPQAERQVAAYVPDYLEPETYFYGEDGPVAALRITWAGQEQLSHRDFLGSLMAQGIKREVLGDLLPGAHSCDILVLRTMADFLRQELTSVGRVRVTVQPVALSALEIPERKVKRITDTVASLRLDSVVAAGFQIGRGKAADLIHGGRAEVNHRGVLKPDRMVEAGDEISIRGLGKLQVAEIRGQTKKGRVALTLERFL